MFLFSFSRKYSGNNLIQSPQNIRREIIDLFVAKSVLENGFMAGTSVVNSIFEDQGEYE